MDLTKVTQEQLEQEYHSGSPTSIELRAILAEITEHGQMRFTKEDAENRYPELVAAGLLGEDGMTVAGKNIGIKSTPIFVYALYNHFGSLLSYTIGPDIKTLLAFVDSVIDALQDKGIIYGLRQVAEGMTEVLLHISVFEHAASVFEYATQIDLTVIDTGTEDFWHILLANWPRWKFSTDQTWAICRHWSLGLSTVPDHVRDYDISLIGKFIRGFAKVVGAEATRLKNLVIGDLFTSGIDELIVATCVGLSEGGHLSITEWLPWLDKTETAERAIMIAANVTVLRADILGLLDKVDATLFSEQANLFLPQFYENILKSTTDDDTEIRLRCQNKFESFLLADNPLLVQRTILVVGRLNDDDAKWTGILIELLKSGKYKDALTPVVASFFARRKSVDSFQSFLVAYAQWKGINADYNGFTTPINVLSQHDQRGIEKLLLEMIIHDEGSVRWAGNQMLYDILLSNQKPVLQFDILELDMLSQYKLAVHVLHPFRQVNETFPIALPLLMSPEKAVRSVTEYKLLELIHHFRDVVVKQVDISLSAGYPDRVSLMKTLQNEVNELLKETEFKVGIRELDPQLNQPRLYRSYWTIYRKKSREELTRAQQGAGSIFSLAQKISVPRGGGWKPTSTSDIQHLKKVSVTWSLSRLFTIIPDKMELVFKWIYLEDHPKNEFDGWQTKLF